MADAIKAWEKLLCPQCDGSTFVAIVGLEVRHGSGMVATSNGWECVGCRGHVNASDMIAAAELRRLEGELTAQRERLVSLKQSRQKVAPAMAKS